MKLELKIKLADYETLGITTNEYKTGIYEQDNLFCVDEILSILKIHYKYFPKSIGNYLNIYENIRIELLK